MAQLLLNGLINAALIAPPAVAFTLLFGVLRFPNFAIGGYITAGAFVAFAANDIRQALRDTGGLPEDLEV